MLPQQGTAMNDRPTALERAITLAQSGEFASVQEIKKQLKAEGLDADQVTGRALSRQLTALIMAARLGAT
jgi:hypothetical protein